MRAKGNYLVYSFQYNDMPQPKWKAIPYYGRITLDCLPPTVIKMHHVSAANAKEALQVHAAIAKATQESES